VHLVRVLELLIARFISFFRLGGVSLSDPKNVPVVALLARSPQKQRSLPLSTPFYERVTRPPTSSPLFRVALCGFLESGLLPKSPSFPTAFRPFSRRRLFVSCYVSFACSFLNIISFFPFSTDSHIFFKQHKTVTAPPPLCTESDSPLQCFFVLTRYQASLNLAETSLVLQRHVAPTR